MNRYLITPPSDEVLTVDECKTMLGITDSSQDGMIEAAIAASVAQLDPAGGGTLGRALRPQSWEVRLSAFPCEGRIVLPFPPLISIDSITYDDENGSEQTLTPDAYQVTGIKSLGQATIRPVAGGSWPATRLGDEAVRIQYQCGYEGDDLPATVKNAVGVGTRMLMAMGEQSLFLSSETIEGVETRSWIVSDAAANAVARTQQNLLSGLQVYE